jgi:hypothetical protein
MDFSANFPVTPVKRRRKKQPYRPNTSNLCIDEVCEVIREEHGLISPAAIRLGVTRSVLSCFVRTRQKCITVLKEAREALGDKAEQRLYDLIEAGDYRAIVFYLTTMCKDRGYVLPRGTSPPPEDAPVEVVVYRTVEEIRRELERRGISFEAIERLEQAAQQVQYIEHDEVK